MSNKSSSNQITSENSNFIQQLRDVKNLVNKSTQFASENELRNRVSSQGVTIYGFFLSLHPKKSAKSFSVGFDVILGFLRHSSIDEEQYAEPDGIKLPVKFDLPKVTPESYDKDDPPPPHRFLFPFSRYTVYANQAVAEKFNCFDFIQMNNVTATCRLKPEKDDFGQYSVFLNVGSAFNFNSMNLYDIMGTDAYEALFGMTRLTECEKEFDSKIFESRYDRETPVVLSIDHFDQEDPEYDTNMIKRNAVCTRYSKKDQPADFDPYTLKDKHVKDKINIRAALDYIVIQGINSGTPQRVGCDTVLYGESLVPFGITNPQTWKLVAGAFFEHCDYKLIADVDVQNTQGYHDNTNIDFGVSLRTTAFFPDVPGLYRRIGIPISVDYAAKEYNIRDKMMNTKNSAPSPFIICLSERTEGVVMTTADYEFVVIPSTINYINKTQIEKISELTQKQGDELVRWLKVEKIPSNQKALAADDKVYDIHSAIARKDVDPITFAVKKKSVKPERKGDKEKNPLLFFRSESDSNAPSLLLLTNENENKGEDKLTDPSHKSESTTSKIQKIQKTPLEFLSEEEEEEDDFKQLSQRSLSDDSNDEEMALKKTKKKQKHHFSVEKTSKKRHKK